MNGFSFFYMIIFVEEVDDENDDDNSSQVIKTNSTTRSMIRNQSEANEARKWMSSNLTRSHQSQESELKEDVQCITWSIICFQTKKSPEIND